MEIDIVEQTDRGARPDADLLQKAFARALARNAAEPEQPSFVSLVFVDDAQISELSGRFRGCAHATDVLSFPLDSYDMETERVHVGEIVVSVDTAEREAVAREMAPQTELLLYAVHGLLHLLGYDDEDDASRAEMVREQFAVLADVGIDVDRARTGF